MKKLLYISFIFAILLVFNSCEKEVITPNHPEGEVMSDGGIMPTNGTRGGDNVDPSVDPDPDPSITDPDEDEDFETEEDGGGGVVDPDEDEDFEGEDGSGGVVDPDEDEDFEGEEENQESGK